MKRIGILGLTICLLLTVTACDDLSSNTGGDRDDSYDDITTTTTFFDDTNGGSGDNDDVVLTPSVHYIHNRTVQDNDNKGYTFLFSFLDENENEIKAPATVKLRIVNDAGATVYNATKDITEDDFSTWSNRLSGQSWLQAAIYINFSEITAGTTENGKLYYQITTLSGASFDEFDLTIDDLPLKGNKITLPSVPKVIHDYDYRNDVETSVKITNITYEISGDDLYIYFTGEKTYDDEGSGYSRSCNVGWKLYDSENYIVDSGTFYSPAIKVGEKFRNEKCYAWDVIVPGENYRLEIENVD